jgi:hypothetical protein
VKLSSFLQGLQLIAWANSLTVFIPKALSCAALFSPIPLTFVNGASAVAQL